MDRPGAETSGEKREVSLQPLAGPPLPPKTLPRSWQHRAEDGGRHHHGEAKRQKLSLSLQLRGVLETDLDSASPPPQRWNKSPERKLSQVSCDWRRAGHVTPVLTADWLQDISAKVSKFEALAQSQAEAGAEKEAGGGSPGTKSLWFYRDGLRAPATPPPRPAQLTMAPAPSHLPAPAPEPELMTRSCVAVLDSGEAAAPGSESSSLVMSRSQGPASIVTSSPCLPSLAPVAAKPPPPPLPPKQRTQSPPPRPVSKELRLEDILLLCAEYERQIEAEKQELVAAQVAAAGQARLEAAAPLSPVSSPSATLQPRIKTNGSLPRDGKRLPSPARSLPPTSPLVSSLETDNSGSCCSQQ